MFARLFPSLQAPRHDIQAMHPETYIHGTTSSLLDCLPNTDWSLCSGRDLVYKYHITPSSGEIFLGGYGTPFCEGRPAFGRIEKSIPEGYDLKRVITGYTQPQPQNTAKQITSDEYRTAGFRNINTLLFRLLSTDTDDVTLQNIQIDLQNEINYLYACLFLLGYVVPHDQLHDLIDDKLEPIDSCLSIFIPPHRVDDPETARKNALEEKEAELIRSAVSGKTEITDDVLQETLKTVLTHLFNSQIEISEEEITEYFKLKSTMTIPEEKSDYQDRFLEHDFFEAKNLNIIFQLLSNTKEKRIRKLTEDMYTTFLLELINILHEASDIIDKIRNREIRPSIATSAMAFSCNPFPMILLVERENPKLEPVFGGKEYRPGKDQRLIIGEDIKTIAVATEENAETLGEYFALHQKDVKIIVDERILAPVTKAENDTRNAGITCNIM